MLCLGGSAYGQVSSLNLASGSAVKGGSISLNLSLSVSGAAPAGLQWTLAYPSSDITSFNIVAGPALTAVSDTLTCASGVGMVNCLATGMNSSTISSGVVAVVTATIAAGTTSSADSIPICNVMGVYSDGTFAILTATGATLSLTSAVPTINMLSPTSATAGTGAFTLTVTGTGFISGSVVNWNGSSRTTTYVSATQLTAAITAADIATVGTGQVTVTNPAPGGGTSGSAAFVISGRPCRSTNVHTSIPNRVCGGRQRNLNDVRGMGIAASQSQNVVTDLFCTPKIMAAGSQATCELRVDSTSEPMQIRVTSSSEHVKAPSAVVTRANQTRLTFQVAADALAGGQLATITATAGTATAQETIQVQASSGPVLTVPSTQAGRLGKALRFTVSAVDPAGLPVQLTAVNAPVGASFDAASGLFEWIPSASQSGKYKVTFGATNSGRQSSSAEVTVNVGSGLPSLANSERLVCSPGSLASLNGSGFGEPGAALSDSSGNSMVLGGTQVKINGQSAPVLFASDARVSFLCPALEADTQLEAAVETEAGISESVTAPMQQVSPMMFSLDGSGENQGVISFAGTTELAMARNFQAAGHPAQPGDEILIWGSGFGTPTEVPAVEVKLGGVDAEVESVSAVAGHAGVYTIQARVPAGTDFGEAVPVQVQVTTPDGKQFRSNKLTLALEPVSQ